jgi:hypothetical protein
MGCDAVGIAINPLYQAEIAVGKIIQLPIEAPELSTNFAVITLNKYLKSPGIKAFTKHLVEVAKNI